MKSSSAIQAGNPGDALLARVRQEVRTHKHPSAELAREVAAAANQLSPTARESLLSTFRQAGWPPPLQLVPQPANEPTPGRGDWSTSKPTAAPSLGSVLRALHGQVIADKVKEYIEVLDRELELAARDPRADLVTGLSLGQWPGAQLENDLAAAAKDRFGPSAQIHVTRVHEGAPDEYSWISVRLDPQTDARRQGVIAERVREFMERTAVELRTAATHPGRDPSRWESLGQRPAPALMDAIRAAVHERLGPHALVGFHTRSPGTHDEYTVATVSLYRSRA